MINDEKTKCIQGILKFKINLRGISKNKFPGMKPDLLNCPKKFTKRLLSNQKLNLTNFQMKMKFVGIFFKSPSQ